MLARIRTQLLNAGSASIAAGQEKYLKGVVKFYGINSKGVTNVFNSLYKSEIHSLSLPKKVELVSGLMASSYFEEKNFGVFLPTWSF